jgi:acetone carboxylase gamma subunit
VSYPENVIRDLIDGRLPWSQTHQIMSSYKDTDRFRQYVAILQQRVAWRNRILLPLTERLSIVESGERVVVKCQCGHEYGDYRENWKLEALVRVRRTEEDIREIYGPFGCDPDWMEIREFICPGCRALLEVEAAVPGYPVVFDFAPDLETFYREWLGEEPPSCVTAA